MSKNIDLETLFSICLVIIRPNWKINKVEVRS